jgi:hypothetical protein
MTIQPGNQKVMEEFLNDPEFLGYFKENPADALKLLEKAGVALSPQALEELKMQTKAADGKLDSLLSKSGPGIDGKNALW